MTCHSECQRCSKGCDRTDTHTKHYCAEHLYEEAGFALEPQKRLCSYMQWRQAGNAVATWKRGGEARQCMRLVEKALASNKDLS